MDIYVKNAIENEIKRLEEQKQMFPREDEQWLYEPDLSRLKEALAKGDK